MLETMTLEFTNPLVMLNMRQLTRTPKYPKEVNTILLLAGMNFQLENMI
jgi:hypothetical protein